MVQQSGEPFLLSLLCYFSYTFEPLGHASPAQRPARALLSRVSLGPFPSLRRLRPATRALLSRVSLGPFPSLRRLRPATPEVNLCDFRFCSPASSLLWKGLTSPASSSSALTPRLPDADHSAISRAVEQEISRFPCKERTYMPSS
jgi:hypothetical protein